MEREREIREDSYIVESSHKKIADTHLVKVIVRRDGQRVHVTGKDSLKRAIETAMKEYG